MLKLAYGNNFDAPVEALLENGAIVLDSGCGKSSLWVGFKKRSKLH